MNQYIEKVKQLIKEGHDLCENEKANADQFSIILMCGEQIVHGENFAQVGASGFLYGNDLMTVHLLVDIIKRLPAHQFNLLQLMLLDVMMNEKK